jgi:mRNA interferase MazF
MVAKNPGQIVLFNFPQTNLVIGKLRPALLIKQISSDYGDWLTCMISTKTAQEVVNLDNIIETTDEDFVQSGLKSSSVFRLTRLAVIAESVPIGVIGEVSQERLLLIRRKLARWIEDE